MRGSGLAAHSHTLQPLRASILLKHLHRSRSYLLALIL